jgi:hypothetical protein
MPGPFSTDRRNALLKHLVSPRSAPVANLQHETAATNARRGGSYCAHSRLASHEWRSTLPAPPLCKQGVRGSSPLGSTSETPSENHVRTSIQDRGPGRRFRNISGTTASRGPRALGVRDYRRPRSGVLGGTRDPSPRTFVDAYVKTVGPTAGQDVDAARFLDFRERRRVLVPTNASHSALAM